MHSLIGGLPLFSVLIGAAQGLAIAQTNGTKFWELQHKLRVCNAYPLAANLDVYRGAEKLTKDSPMPYKSCRDFVAPLKSGDKLIFKLGDANAGTFAVAHLPESAAVLLLIIHRHDALSTAASFDSHVFASLLNAQIAIIDTYKGSAKTQMRIRDGVGASGRDEGLHYDSVVALNPGKYEVGLFAPDGKLQSQRNLVALNRESYVILRTGIDAKDGPSYPQELIVFPQSDEAALYSAATPRFSLMGSFITMVVAAVLSCVA